MPTAPEILYARRRIWAIEIVAQFNPHHFCDADCNFGIPRKVAINLYGEQNSRYQYGQTVCSFHVIIHAVNKNRNAIRYYYFFEIPDYCYTQAAEKHFIIELYFCFKLWNKVFRSFNRSRYKLGKERNEKRVITEMSFGFYSSSIYVYNIGKRLESIKRYSDRKNQAERKLGNVCVSEINYVDYKIYCKSKIFKEEQHAQTADKRNNQTYQFYFFTLELFHEQSRKIRNQRSKKYEKNKPCVPAHIKQVTDNEKHYPPKTFRQQPVCN